VRVGGAPNTRISDYATTNPRINGSVPTLLVDPSVATYLEVVTMHPIKKKCAVLTITLLVLTACGGSPSDVPTSSAGTLTTSYDDHVVTSSREGSGEILTVLTTFDGIRRLGLLWDADARALVWTTDVRATVTALMTEDLAMPELNELAHALWEEEESLRSQRAGAAHPGLQPQSEMQVCDGVAFTTDGCDAQCGGESDMYCYASCMASVIGAALAACEAAP
jgi:hypothetical protein